ncbi:MAG: caspase family protein, partial [Thermoguttaceae bacterium]|nr:caspase family protein [Thermoguttaceae bacterium]
MSKTVKMGKMRKAAFALLTATFFGVATSDAPAQTSDASGSRALEVVAKESSSCYALLIGVDKYDNITPLNYASSDAEAIRETLLKIGFPEENIWRFTSKGSRYELPTKANIEKAFEEILAEAGPNATIFVAMSGHGFETKDGEAAFCPKGVVVEEIDGETVVTRESAIVVNDITKRLREDDAKFKLLIVDACRESATTKNAVPSAGRPFAKIDASGVAFLQSCQTKQFSYEDAEFGRGLFTHFFIDGLNGAADADGDGGVSFLDVCGYASRMTQERAKKVFKGDQTPHFRFDGSDFWLKEPTGKPGPKVDAAELYRQGRELAFGLDGRKIDGKRGFELLTQAAEAGSSDAKGALAYLYYEGCAATPPRLSEAFKFAKEAADAGNPLGQYVLGSCYREGRGAVKNATRAKEQFKAARAGFEKLANDDQLASTFLGVCLLYGYGG